jgi:transposase
MSLSTFLPHLRDLVRKDVIGDADHLTVMAVSHAPSAACPLCHQPSRRRHSTYRRTIADLPWSATPVTLCIQVRRFFCTNSQCRRRIFCERLQQIASVSSRRTQRLRASLAAIGLAVGGRAGARLARQLHVTCSRLTVLRLVAALPVPEVGPVRVVGIDDFAFKRGRRYGTLVCDHERQCPIDLLPERTAAAVAAWLREHPEVEIITRDRAAVYKEGATRGAPQAVQVVDRFHMLKNPSAALEEDFARVASVLQEIATRCADPARAAGAPPDAATSSTSVPQSGQDSPANPVILPAAALHTGRVSATKQALYTAVHDLHAQGSSQQAIARHLGINRRTVRRYLGADQGLDPRVGRCLHEPYLPYLLQRWTEGCHNGTQLWREIRAQGYPGARSTLIPLFVQLRKLQGIPPRQRRPPTAQRTTLIASQPVRLRSIVFAFLARPETLDLDEQRYLDTLCAHHAGLAAEYRLTQAFVALLHTRQGGALSAWATAATAEGLPHLRAFAAGLRQDWAAVEAGFTLPWNNGRSEGLINRLKMIKRSMFGRAGFALLRHRVLARPE